MTSSKNGAPRLRRRSELRRAQRKARRRSAEPATRSLPNTPLLFSALCGMAIAGYLTFARGLHTSPVGCEPGSACDLVQASRFALLLGIPIAAWGLALYGALAAVALSVRGARLHARLSLVLSGLGVGVSLYLAAVSVIELGVVCVWCGASLGAMTACFVIALAQARGPLLRELWAIAAGSGVFLAALHLYYDEPSVAPGSEASKLQALAIHLEATGARFYGASWCRMCAKQKALFGDAASLLPYVECKPEGRGGPQASVCVAQRIKLYPTWIIGGDRHEGLLAADTLAALSNFNWSGSAPATRDAAEVDPDH